MNLNLKLTKNQNQVENHHSFIVSYNSSKLNLLILIETDVTLNLKFVQSTFFLSTICKHAYKQYVLDLVSRSPEVPEHQSHIEQVPKI